MLSTNSEIFFPPAVINFSFERYIKMETRACPSVSSSFTKLRTIGELIEDVSPT